MALKAYDLAFYVTILLQTGHTSQETKIIHRAEVNSPGKMYRFICGRNILGHQWSRFGAETAL